VEPLRLDEPDAPFGQPGYYAVHLGRFGYRAKDGRIVSVRDSLTVCPIPSTLLIEAIRSGRLDGTVVTRAGHRSAEVSDSRKIAFFVAAHAELQFCQHAPDSYWGVRSRRDRRPVEWHENWS